MKAQPKKPKALEFQSVSLWEQAARRDRVSFKTAMPGRNNFVIFSLSLVLFFAAFQSAATAQLNDRVPSQVENVTVDQKLGDSVPLDILLVDSNGQATKTGHFFDSKRPVLLTLNYSNCPVLCNVQLNALVEGLNSLSLRIGRDFQILTVSIDPKETTERIRETKSKYIEMLDQQPGADGGWHFCTARESSIKRLADAVGFRYTYDAKTGEYYHPAMLAFVSPDGVISRYSLDVAFPPEQTKLALIDASSGTIGTAVDQFIMWCFSYDADRGSYVLGAWRLMQLGAAMTVLVLLVTLVPYWIGRKRSARGSAAVDIMGHSAV
ncbi:MAG TPA: SCO family protein [Planctomycetaceae bacterium]|nr:SCO family protein [Planctomycetaceae bacterium]